ncbi:MAG: hypothetical protein ACOC1P_01140 [Minisyncoccales bacterium]
MKFSKIELRDLFFAWILISLAFAILLSGAGLSNISGLAISFFVSALTVGISFLFHELSHKLLAQRYKLWAEFRAFYNMLFLAIALSFLGFIIAAPGAVMIRGSLSKEKNGKISLAGPLTNIILALIFLPFFFLITEGVLGLIFRYGLIINSLLAVFNLLPVPGFDGRKVYEWNPTIYAIAGFVALGLFIISMLF